MLSGQPQWVRFFKKVSLEKKMSHSYIIEGSDSEELLDFSLWLAQLLVCPHQKEDGDACGDCLFCQRIKQEEYSDLLTIEPDGQSIKVEQIREAKQMMTKSAIEGRAKILVVRDAEKMNASSQNRLLKFIEEPEGDTFVFFLTNQLNRLLPTIQSRCQQIVLKPISKKELRSYLEQKEIPEKTAHLLSEVTHSKQAAVELFQNEWFNNAKTTVEKWYQHLEKRHPLAFVDVQQRLVKMAKEREQQLLIFDLLLFFMRDYQVIQGIQTKDIEQVLLARNKLKANVSFQNVCEQLVWRLIG